MIGIIIQIAPFIYRHLTSDTSFSRYKNENYNILQAESLTRVLNEPNSIETLL